MQRMGSKDYSVASTADDGRQVDTSYDTDEEWAPNPYQTEADAFMHAFSQSAKPRRPPPVTICSFMEPCETAPTTPTVSTPTSLKRQFSPPVTIFSVMEPDETAPIAPTMSNTPTSRKRQLHSKALKLIGERNFKGLEPCLTQLIQMDGTVGSQLFKKVIFACARDGDTDRAESWWSWFVAHGVAPSPYNYNAMVSAYSRINKVAAAEYYLGLMMQAGSLPSIKSLSWFVDACANVGATCKAEAWFTRMTESGIKADQILYHSMLKVHANSGNVWACAAWLSEMRLNGVEPVAISYNIMIHACAKAGRAPEAERWYNEMVAVGCTPDHFTFGSLIAAAAKNGDIRQAKRWFEALISAGLAPNEICVRAVLKAFLCSARSRRPEEQEEAREAALEWVEELRRQGGMKSMGMSGDELQALLHSVFEDPGSPLRRRACNVRSRSVVGLSKQPPYRRRTDASLWRSR